MLGKWVTIPKDLKARYIEMCKEYNEEPCPQARRRIKLRAEGFKEAIRIRYPDSVGHILIEADLALPDDDRPACGGMYLDLDRGL